MKHYPQACGIKNKHLYSPLHVALECVQCSIKVAKIIVKTFPDVLKMKTKLKETPKMIALRKMHENEAQNIVTINEISVQLETSEDENNERLKDISVGIYGKKGFYTVYEGAPKLEITEGLLDILTTGDKGNKKWSVNGLVSRIMSSIQSFAHRESSSTITYRSSSCTQKQTSWYEYD